MKGNGMKRFNGGVSGFGLSVLFLVVAMTIGVAPVAVAAEPLKVAAVFETPIEEPWVNQIHVALVKAKKEMGIVYDYSESVKSADFARVMREYAEKGYRLITGDAFGAERIARRVARDYPDVAFVFGSGIGPAEPNFGVFDNWIHEPAYLCGMIAGKMTKTNTIGVVAAMPIPEVNRLSNAFYAGAKEVNKDVTCKFSFIGSFFDPPKAKEAALAQIEAGVDVIYAERFGVVEAAVEKGDPGHFQHVRPVQPGSGYGDHRPGVGHVAHGEAGHQPGQGRRLHRPGLRRIFLHVQGRLLSGAVSQIRTEAAGRGQGDGGKTQPRRFWTGRSGWILMNPSRSPIRSCIKIVFQPNFGVGSVS
jgi:hypothetical protein